MSDSQDKTNRPNEILTVGAEIQDLQLLSEMLSREGCQVRSAENLQRAIDSALAQPPKLILLNVSMPDIDGFEACKRLKQDERTRDVPILFISARHQIEDKVQCFEAGGVDLITRPFQEDEVLARVRTHLELRNMQLQLEELVNRRTSDIKKSEERFRVTFEQAAVGIAHVSTKGKFLRLNQKFCDIVGYTQDELLGMSFQDITHPDHLDADLAYLRKVMKGGTENYTTEKKYIRKDGSIIWASLNVSMLFDSGGAPQYFVSVIQDISGRKLIEEDLQKNRDFLENHLFSLQIYLDGVFTRRVRPQLRFLESVVS